MTSRLTERLVSSRGAGLLVAVALLSYALQALAWPLQRGRDSWDYWLAFLQLGDPDPPFSALQVFRTPVAPLVTGIPMWLGGARLTEVVFAVLYALSILGWAWAVVPISRRVALATALVLLVTPTYAGLFHEVSSDPVFAFLLAWWAGVVVRAWKYRGDVMAGSRRRGGRAADPVPTGLAGCCPRVRARAPRGAAWR